MNCTQKAKDAIPALKATGRRSPCAAIANSSLTAYSGAHFSTPQRKAKLHDKQRIRLKDAKEWALHRSKCADTAEVKKYLKLLGKKLDLRLTSAWVAVNKEFADKIKQLKLAETFIVGSKVEWSRQVISGQILCPEKPGSRYKPLEAHICAWFPLVITAIIDGKAQLDVWANPVPL